MNRREDDIGGECVNTRLVRVPAGATLKITCPFVNSGQIYLESGAILDYPAGITNNGGQIRRSPCCPAACVKDITA
ncbi:hypothetical protein [Botrimarina mediterranea]|uniref:Uncharacterized protein n=1 Tax=Botrimarina mediterranea TaxID=2528022 RepID=A0A518K936_9BACT|nr:hypothetical protein [Botrimarina mediterranea]QDV74304.1 hypothetical protein Spa11_25050 [Botrimarina mediterranea]